MALDDVQRVVAVIAGVTLLAALIAAVVGAFSKTDTTTLAVIAGSAFGFFLMVAFFMALTRNDQPIAIVPSPQMSWLVDNPPYGVVLTTYVNLTNPNELGVLPIGVRLRYRFKRQWRTRSVEMLPLPADDFMGDEPLAPHQTGALHQHFEVPYPKRRTPRARGRIVVTDQLDRRHRARRRVTFPVQPPRPPGPPVNFAIDEASYGAGETWKTVTEAVRAAVVDGHLHLLVGNAAFGDPVPDTPKSLRLRYTFNSQTFNNEYPESTQIDLP